MNWTIIQLFVLIELSFSLAPNELIIFILSQFDDYHYQLAEELRADIYNQSNIIAKDNFVNVHLMHETFQHPGYWTFLAILPNIKSTNLIKTSTKWIILCEDRSSIDLKILIDELNSKDHNQMAYYGYPLHDKEATIIHHFSFFENPQWFSYPLLRSGVIFTIPLIKRLTKCVQEEKPTMDFFIDASHELSLFIWQNIKFESKTTIATQSSKIQDTSSSTSDSSSSFFHLNQTTSFSSNSQATLSNLTTTNNSSGQIITGNLKNSKILSSEPQLNTTDHHKTLETNNKNQNVNSVSNVKNNIIKKSSSSFLSKNQDNHNHKELNESNHNMNATIRWHKLQMKTVSFLCLNEGRGGCAIHPNKFIPECDPVRPEAIYFAIKTCHKFHKERIQIIETTWGQYAVHKRYFSDIADENIPTISTGIPNTETGHCAKTLTIFKLALDEITEMNLHYRINKRPMIEWIFLSDDDTILSVSAVCNYLGCFNPEDDIYLGERYGYRLHSKDGFNYITGGGGIIFSLPTIRKIVASCSCPTISSPDDMIVGVCLQRLGVKAIHSSKFHQARPLDYSLELLKLDEPISFHKFWQINPIKIYKKWFKKSDNNLINNVYESKSRRNINNNNNNNNCDINYSRSSSTKFRKSLKNGNTRSLEYENDLSRIHKKENEHKEEQRQHTEL